MAVMSIMGAIFLGWGSFETFRLYEFIKAAATTQGIVAYTDSYTSMNNTTNYLGVNYQVAGKGYRAEKQTSSFATRGDAVTVYYDRAYPDRAELGPLWSLFAGPFVLIIAAIVSFYAVLSDMPHPPDVDSVGL